MTPSHHLVEDARSLPYSAEAEQHMLGALLCDNRLVRLVSGLLSPEHFGNALHARIWTSITMQVGDGALANPVTLKEVFDQDPELKDRGGGQYLMTLAQDGELVDRPEHYARHILELAQRRDIIAAAQDLADAGRSDFLNARAADILARHQARVDEIKRGTVDSDDPESDYVLSKLPSATWLDRDIPDPDFLLGELLSTTSRLFLIAPTGLGKTNFALAIATATSTGTAGFLHWRIPKARRVLYVDGEMSDRLMKKRAVDAVRRNGGHGQLFILSREDFPAMPPLDTPAGQKFIDRIIDVIGGVDLVVFDNIQALLTPAGEDFGVASWEKTLPWVRELTRRKIGQIWIHHTGYDESHGYGTKTREWQMDTVAIMDRVERPDIDIAFKLDFSTKARERTPENRGDFETVTIWLAADAWQYDHTAATSTKRPASQTPRVLELLQNAIARHGTIPPPHVDIPEGAHCVTEQQWREACELGCISEGTEESTKRAIRRAFKALLKDKQVGICKPWVWIVR